MGESKGARGNGVESSRKGRGEKEEIHPSRVLLTKTLLTSHPHRETSALV